MRVSLFLRVDLPAALLFPFLVVAFARNDGWPARILEARWLYFLGVVSYSLYLVHSPLRFAEYDILVAIHPEKLSGVAALAFAGLASLTSIPLAWACYRLIERPGRDVFRHLLHARPVREPKGQRI